MTAAKWNQLTPPQRNTLIERLLSFFILRENQQRPISCEELQRYSLFQFDQEQVTLAMRICGAAWLFTGYQELENGFSVDGLSIIGMQWRNRMAGRYWLALIWFVQFLVLTILNVYS